MRSYERFLNYVVVNTRSDESSATYPSSACQFELGKLLAEEMKAIGIADARCDEFCYVYGTIPATPGLEDKPALGLIAHMDTSPECSGENVKPILHANYDGKDVTLPDGTVLSLEKFPFLAKLKGETLITTDGTTLLGADDKAGVAEIMTAVEELIVSGRPHGKVCVCFTPDEEIGKGIANFDIPGFGADFAYTVDGGDVGNLEYENFNADSAHLDIRGFLVHPGTSKNKMINAINVAMEFQAALPAMDRPEHTQGREGFFHLLNFHGSVTDAHMDYIIRDHDRAAQEHRKATMHHIADCLNEKYGAGTISLEIKEQYRNMIEKIVPDHEHLLEHARKAIRMAGLEPVEVPFRGGTDGAMLSWKGLPCPNLGTGGFNFHGTGECITVERMDKATEILSNVIDLYAK